MNKRITKCGMAAHFMRWTRYARPCARRYMPMRFISCLILSLFSVVGYGDNQAKEFSAQAKMAVEMYMDGYSEITREPETKVINYDGGGCVSVSSISVEAFGVGNNYSQFIVIGSCAGGHPTMQPSKKIFLSSVIKFYSPNITLDVNTTVYSDGALLITSSDKKASVKLEVPKNSRWWVVSERKGI